MLNSISICILAVAVIICGCRLNTLTRKYNEIHRDIRALTSTEEDTYNRMYGRIAEIEKKCSANSIKIEELEKGIVPDYATAKKASDAVNDFAKGIAGILGFDPYVALHKDEQETK